MALMTEPYWWYVLFVRASAEERVVQDLQRFYSAGGKFDYAFEPFCPQSEYFYRSKKAQSAGKQYRKRALFPCYVFVETNMPSDVFLREFSAFVRSSPDIVRVLRYGGSDEIALPRDERMRFEYLFKGKRCVDHSVGYIAGDSIVVLNGPLIGREGVISRIDRHNRSAVIKLEMFGGTVEAKVALEIVEKTT